MTGLRTAEPFTTPAEAWFWTIRALKARQEGRSGAKAAARTAPCDPDDVIHAVDFTYRRRVIGLPHVQVLRRWGDRGSPPDPHANPADFALWTEAMNGLGVLLRAKGIVA